MRECKRCGELKPLEEFYGQNRRICKVCDRERAREYKRRISPTWKGEVKPAIKRGLYGKQLREVKSQRVFKPSIQAHIDALNRLRGVSKTHTRVR